MQALGSHEASHGKVKTLVGVGAENFVLEKSQGGKHKVKLSQVALLQSPDQSVRQGRCPHPDSDSADASARN